MSRAEPKTSPRRVAVAERRAKATRLRAQGLTYQQIAAQLGYKTAANAIQDVQRYLASTAREATDEVRAIEVQRLDQALVELLQIQNEITKVLRKKHVVVSHGHIVLDDTGTPLEDDGVALTALTHLMAVIDRRIRIMERRAKLLGLDAPTKHEVITIDAIENEIRKLNAELSAVPDPTEAAGID